jgi:hypothetical protein
MVQSAFGIAGAWVGCKLADLGEAVKWPLFPFVHFAQRLRRALTIVAPGFSTKLYPSHFVKTFLQIFVKSFIFPKLHKSFVQSDEMLKNLLHFVPLCGILLMSQGDDNKTQREVKSYA